MRVLPFVGVIIAMAGAPNSATAAPHELVWDLDVDGPLTLALGLSWIGTESVKGTIGATACRWCDTNGFDTAARDALRWGDPMAAHAVSNVLAFAAGPALVLGADLLAAHHDRAWNRFLVDTLLVVEASVIAADVSQLVKFAAQRERPYATAFSEDQKLATDRSHDEHLSFYSGHTTLMFAVATSAGTIASMRGYRFAPLVWLVGLPLATATGYLRVAADYHWMTDVLVGAVAGVAIGFAVPFFAHRRVKIAPVGLGVGIAGVLE